MDKKLEKKPFYKKRSNQVVFAIVLIFIITVANLLSDTDSKLNVDLDKITVSKISEGEFQEFIPVSGNVLPYTTVFLDAFQGGTIEKKFVEEGAILKKSDKIVKLSNINLELNALSQESFAYQQINAYQNTKILLEQNTINLKARAQDVTYNLQRSKQIFERQKKLWDKKLISQQEFELSKDEYMNFVELNNLSQENLKNDSLNNQLQLKQIKENLERLYANLRLVKESIENLTIKSPINGQLTSLDVEIGESKSIGQRIGQIDVLNGYKVRAAIDEFYISRVSPGLGGSFNFDGKEFRIKIYKVYSEVKNGKFEVDLEFDGITPDGIKRGQTLQIKLELGDYTKALLLARGGFYQKTGGQWIYVVDPSGQFAIKKQIKIGRQNPNYFELLEGLLPGESVITSSYDTYQDIDKLILK